MAIGDGKSFIRSNLGSNCPSRWTKSWQNGNQRETQREENGSNEGEMEIRFCAYTATFFCLVSASKWLPLDKNSAAFWQRVPCPPLSILLSLRTFSLFPVTSYYCCRLSPLLDFLFLLILFYFLFFLSQVGERCRLSTLSSTSYFYTLIHLIYYLLFIRFIPIIFTRRKRGQVFRQCCGCLHPHAIACPSFFFFLFHRRHLNSSFDLAVAVQLAKPDVEHLKLWLFRSMSFHANSNLGAGGCGTRLRRRTRMETRRRWRL